MKNFSVNRLAWTERGFVHLSKFPHLQALIAGSCYGWVGKRRAIRVTSLRVQARNTANVRVLKILLCESDSSTQRSLSSHTQSDMSASATSSREYTPCHSARSQVCIIAQRDISQKPRFLFLSPDAASLHDTYSVRSDAVQQQKGVGLRHRYRVSTPVLIASFA